MHELEYSNLFLRKFPFLAGFLGSAFACIYVLFVQPK